MDPILHPGKPAPEMVPQCDKPALEWINPGDTVPWGIVTGVDRGARRFRVSGLNVSVCLACLKVHP